MAAVSVDTLGAWFDWRRKLFEQGQKKVLESQNTRVGCMRDDFVGELINFLRET